MKRSTVVAVVPATLITVVLALSACGSTPQASSPSAHSAAHGSSAPSTAGKPASGPHNPADVAFATDMIPHHRQAVEMADMVPAQGNNADVKKLALQIKGAQAPEITKMSGWLSGWGKPVPSSSMPGGMSGMSMNGMMSPDDMSKLSKTRGTAFDKLWLSMMITHHQGAVTMSRTERAQGTNPDAKKLATSIISSQSKQIATMKSLSTTIGG